MARFFAMFLPERSNFGLNELLGGSAGLCPTLAPRDVHEDVALLGGSFVENQKCAFQQHVFIVDLVNLVGAGVCVDVDPVGEDSMNVILSM